MIKGSEAATLPRPSKEKLTDVQIQIVQYWAEGLNNDEIAVKMKESYYWVVNAKHVIKKVLNAVDSPNLISICYQKGILKVGE